jgi:tRNA threonylcarbamoyladenosine biosynthesis protein TsaE
MGVIKNNRLIFGINEVEKVVRTNIIPTLDEYTIITFQGPLGAGKTTLIKELLRQIGISEVVSSPTFSYVKHYTSPDGKMFHHFDLYRLKSQEGFFEMGFDEYLYDENSWTLIEWPEIINDLLQRSSMSRQVWNVLLSYVEGDLEKRAMEMTSLT